MTREMEVSEIQRLDDYQREALKTATFPKHLKVLYTIMGELGEAGEKGAVLLSIIERALKEDPEFNTPDLQTVKEAVETAVAACSVVERLKKRARKEELTISPLPELTVDEVSRLKFESGDELWYQAATAAVAGLTLSEVCQSNISKLRERQKHGVIVSAGETIAERRAAKSI